MGDSNSTGLPFDSLRIVNEVERRPGSFAPIDRGAKVDEMSSYFTTIKRASPSHWIPWALSNGWGWEKSATTPLGAEFRYTTIGSKRVRI
jgi:hypothetical protein